MRLKSWKSSGSLGGGALGNFVCHSYHYLEWMCGPAARLSAHLSGPPDQTDMETNATVNLVLESGATATIVMSCAAYLGSGHRAEFYGADGTLSLINSTRDYMRGFELRLARRPGEFSLLEIDDPLDRRFPQDGRIAPVARLAAAFLDAIESGRQAVPGFAEGFRVQVLLEAARSAHNDGGWIDTRPKIRGASA
jgi:predicted dehydrogenase